MSTKLGLANSRSVTRESTFRHQGREVLVTLDAGGKLLRFRQKGRRNGYACTIESAFWLAVDVKHQQDKAARIAARKAKRSLRT